MTTNRKKPGNPFPGSRRRGTKPRNLPAGRGAKLLRDSANNAVGRESGRIADALAQKATRGNVPATRVLMQLTGADKPPADSADSKKDKSPRWAQLFLMEEECDTAKLAERNSNEECAAIQQDRALGLPTPPMPPSHTGNQ